MGNIDQLTALDLAFALSQPSPKGSLFQVRVTRQGLFEEMQDEMQEIGLVAQILPIPGINHPIRRASRQHLGARR